jgi:hypothetical protein
MKAIKTIVGRLFQAICYRFFPYGKIHESGGGLQCCCPKCKYGEGTIDSFIDGYSKQFIQRCRNCRILYRSLQTYTVPKSGRSGF